MKMKKGFFLLAVVLLFGFKGGEKRSYQLYSMEGKPLEYSQLVKEAAAADVVLFGELHNNPIVHWLQLELTKDLHSKGKIALGAEMFESDDQLIIDEFLAGRIKHKHLVSEAKVWNNYGTDYQPLMEFAKENQLQFIATNVPRRYANLVAREGLEGLNTLRDEAKQYVAPLPVEVDMETPGYPEMLAMDMGHGSGMTALTMVHAQAIKDATMAHFILQNQRAGTTFIHYHGDFHSRNFGGIYHYLKKAKPDLKVLVISSTEGEVDKLDKDQQGLGNLILVVDGDMTKTY